MQNDISSDNKCRCVPIVESSTSRTGSPPSWRRPEPHRVSGTTVLEHRPFVGSGENLSEIRSLHKNGHITILMGGWGRGIQENCQEGGSSAWRSTRSLAIGVCWDSIGLKAAKPTIHIGLAVPHKRFTLCVDAGTHRFLNCRPDSEHNFYCTSSGQPSKFRHSGAILQLKKTFPAHYVFENKKKISAPEPENHKLSRKQFSRTDVH